MHVKYIYLDLVTHSIWVVSCFLLLLILMLYFFLSFGHVILFVCVCVYEEECIDLVAQCSTHSYQMLKERKKKPKNRNKHRKWKKNGKEETSTQNHTCISTLCFNRMRNDDSDDAKKEMALRHVYIYTEIGKIWNIIYCLAYFLLLLLLLLLLRFTPPFLLNTNAHTHIFRWDEEPFLPHTQKKPT